MIKLIKNMVTTPDVSTLTDFEKEILDHLNILIYVIVGVAFCCVLRFLKDCIESVSYFFHCVWYILSCGCCAPSRRRYYIQRDEEV